MRLDYKLDQRLPVLRAIVLGLQWAVIVTSLVIIMGKVAAVVHHGQPAQQITYLQKLFFVTGAAVLAQVLWGHRLPVISGPATIVLLGVVSNQGSSPAAVYTGVMMGGLVLALLTLSGLFRFVRRLFTWKIVAVILVLIALTLTPTILKLIGSGAGATPLGAIVFALALILVVFSLHRTLTGFCKSTLMIWVMAGGSAVYFLLFPGALGQTSLGGVAPLRGFLSELTLRPVFEPGVIISFLIGFLALSINDIGAMQSMGPLLRPDHMERRTMHGMTITGLVNALAGLLGTIGVVNFSLSPGVVASTACASQFALVPATAFLFLLSFSPLAINILASVPSVVIGCVLLYIMTSQFASGLLLIFQEAKESHFELNDGLAIGLPVLLGTVISFLPADTVAAFPALLKPILGNGFVVGTLSALALEHLILRRRPGS